MGVCAALHIWKLPPALPALQRELGLDLIESGFLLSSVQLAGMTLGLVIGIFAERIGLRRCILIGLAILSLASFSATFFHSKNMVLLSRAIEGCGFLMIVLPVPALIKRLVPADTLSRLMVFITLSSGRVWLVALIFGVYAAQWSAIIGFLPTIYADSNISGPTAGLLTALVAGSNITGNLMAGRLLHKGVSAPKLMTTGFITLMITAFVAFGMGQGAVVQFFAILLLSIVRGLIPATSFVLAVTLAPTPQTTSSTVGWVQQGSALGQFLGAPVVAWVVSLLGGWQWAWVATFAFALCGLVMVFLLSHTMKSTRLT